VTATATETANLEIEVKDAKGKSDGTVTLPADVFDVQVNVPLIHQVVVAQLAAARQGTHDTKSRGGSAAVAASLTARRAPAAPARARPGHRSSPGVASSTARRRGPTPSARPRR
jgi:large subunit ribosomal protein L4